MDVVTRDVEWHKKNRQNPAAGKSFRSSIITQDEKSGISLCHSPFVWGFLVSLSAILFVFHVIVKLILIIIGYVNESTSVSNMYGVLKIISSILCIILEFLAIPIGACGIASGLSTLLSVKYFLSIVFTIGICIYVGLSSLFWSLYVFVRQDGEIGYLELGLYMSTSLLVGIIFGVSLVQYKIVKQARIIYFKEKRESSNYLELDEVKKI